MTKNSNKNVSFAFIKQSVYRICHRQYNSIKKSQSLTVEKGEQFA